MGHWYCGKCVAIVNPINVTFEELHEGCGNSVEWIGEMTPGIIFNQPQKDFYKLSGKKPLISAVSEGISIVTACPEYCNYLQKNYREAKTVQGK